MRIKGGASPFAGLQHIDLQGLRFRLVDAENQVTSARACAFASAGCVARNPACMGCDACQPTGCR